MKKVTWIFMVVLASVFVSCEEDGIEAGLEDGTVLFDLSSLDLDEDSELKSASSAQDVRIETSINGVDYNLAEGETLILPVHNYIISKFDIIVNGIHKYMLGGELEFETIANEIVVVQIPVFRVDDENNEYGKGEFEVIESAYHAIKSGRASYALYYTTDKENRMLYAANIQNSAAEGFPVLRLYNGFSDKAVEYTYYKYQSNETYTFFVGPNTQMYVALPGGKNAAGTWIVKSGSFEKTISIN